MSDGGSRDREVDRSEHRGVPVFCAEGRGAFTGALIFRTGRADEQLRNGGIDHLIEHLAIHPFEALPHAIGGFVDDTRTVFHATGEPAEVASFLNGVCANLTNLPAERIVDERRVLRVEGHNAQPPSPLWALRFGAKGYGLVGYPEYGLHWLEADDLAAWASERFTAANAAAWFTGEPPAELALELPPGRRLAPPAPEPIEDLEIPAWLGSHDGGIWMSLLARRSTGMVAAVALLTERLQEHLRRELGLSYSAGSNYWRLTRDWAHVIAGADSAPAHGSAVREGFLRILDELCEVGPSEDQLERYREMAGRYVGDPDGIAQTLDTYASDALAGAETPSRAQLVEEIRGLRRATVAEELAAAARSMILQLPPGLSAEPDRAVPYSSGPDLGPVDGVTYGPRTAGRTDEQVIVGEQGASHRLEGRTRTVLWKDCLLAALEAKHAVTLVDRWGDALSFHYQGEEAREQIIGSIRAGLPPERVLEIEREVADRFDAVMTLADRQLGDHRGWALIALPQVMFDGEQALLLARAKRGDESGLLAVTDLRVVFIDADGSRLGVELARSEIETAESGRSLLKGTLTLRGRGETHEFSSLPRGRAREIAAALAG